MIIKIKVRYRQKDHPLKIWKAGDFSTSVILSVSYCCGQMKELWEEKIVQFDKRRGKIWLYAIEPNDIDYGSSASAVELKFCFSCGQQTSIYA